MSFLNKQQLLIKTFNFDNVTFEDHPHSSAKNCSLVDRPASAIGFSKPKYHFQNRVTPKTSTNFQRNTFTFQSNSKSTKVFHPLDIKFNINTNYSPKNAIRSTSKKSQSPVQPVEIHKFTMTQYRTAHNRNYWQNQDYFPPCFQDLDIISKVDPNPNQQILRNNSNPNIKNRKSSDANQSNFHQPNNPFFFSQSTQDRTDDVCQLNEINENEFILVSSERKGFSSSSTNAEAPLRQSIPLFKVKEFDRKKIKINLNNPEQLSKISFQTEDLAENLLTQTTDSKDSKIMSNPQPLSISPEDNQKFVFSESLIIHNQSPDQPHPFSFRNFKAPAKTNYNTKKLELVLPNSSRESKGKSNPLSIERPMTVAEKSKRTIKNYFKNSKKSIGSNQGTAQMFRSNFHIPIRTKYSSNSLLRRSCQNPKRNGNIPTGHSSLPKQESNENKNIKYNFHKIPWAFEKSRQMQLFNMPKPQPIKEDSSNYTSLSQEREKESIAYLSNKYTDLNHPQAQTLVHKRINAASCSNVKKGKKLKIRKKSKKKVSQNILASQYKLQQEPNAQNIESGADQSPNSHRTIFNKLTKESKANQFFLPNQKEQKKESQKKEEKNENQIADQKVSKEIEIQTSQRQNEKIFSIGKSFSNLLREKNSEKIESNEDATSKNPKNNLIQNGERKFNFSIDDYLRKAAVSSTDSYEKRMKSITNFYKMRNDTSMGKIFFNSPSESSTKFSNYYELKELINKYVFVSKKNEGTNNNPNKKNLAKGRISKKKKLHLEKLSNKNQVPGLFKMNLPNQIISTSQKDAFFTFSNKNSPLLPSETENQDIQLKKDFVPQILFKN